jgi:hypothetical protein
MEDHHVAVGRREDVDLDHVGAAGRGHRGRSAARCGLNRSNRVLRVAPREPPVSDQHGRRSVIASGLVASVPAQPTVFPRGRHGADAHRSRHGACSGDEHPSAEGSRARVVRF